MASVVETLKRLGIFSLKMKWLSQYSFDVFNYNFLKSLDQD